MKSITAAVLASLALTGVACSQGSSDTQQAEVQTISADGTDGGTINLSLPSPTAEAGESTGSFNLNLGGDTSGGRLIGAGALGGGDFGSDPDLDLGLNLDLDEEADALAANAEASASEDDDIIRLPAKK